jgi:hypothetical protein
MLFYRAREALYVLSALRILIFSVSVYIADANKWYK